MVVVSWLSYAVPGNIFIIRSSWPLSGEMKIQLPLLEAMSKHLCTLSERMCCVAVILWRSCGLNCLDRATDGTSVQTSLADLQRVYVPPHHSAVHGAGRILGFNAQSTPAQDKIV